MSYSIYLSFNLLKEQDYTYYSNVIVGDSDTAFDFVTITTLIIKVLIPKHETSILGRFVSER